MKLEGIEFDRINILPKMNGGWNCVLSEIYLKTSGNNYKITFTGAEK